MTLEPIPGNWEYQHDYINASPIDVSEYVVEQVVCIFRCVNYHFCIVCVYRVTVSLKGTLQCKVNDYIA